MSQCRSVEKEEDTVAKGCGKYRVGVLEVTTGKLAMYVDEEI